MTLKREVMKKLLVILIFGLFFNSNGFAQIFYPNKELNIEKLINLDLSKYKFEDYKKLLGPVVENWNGDPDYKSSRELDWKKIDIKINGSKHKLKFSSNKDGSINLSVHMKGIECEKALSVVPSKYFNKKNYLDYVVDFQIMQTRIIKLSYDNQNESRMIYSCMGYLDSNGEPKNLSEDDPRSMIIMSHKSKVYKKIVPLKMISCKIEKGKMVKDTKYTTLEEPQYANFYISDGEDRLLDEEKIFAGKNIKYNKDLIHTEKTYKFKKSDVKNQFQFFNEYKIDRINGSFYHRLKRYGPKVPTPDNTLEIEYFGSCVKKDIEERAF